MKVGRVSGFIFNVFGSDVMGKRYIAGTLLRQMGRRTKINMVTVDTNA